MRVKCSKCQAVYAVHRQDVFPDGREMECTACDHLWYQTGLPLEKTDQAAAAAIITDETAVPLAKPWWTQGRGLRAAALAGAAMVLAVAVAPVLVARNDTDAQALPPMSLQNQASASLRRTIQTAIPNGGLQSLIMPVDGDLASIPQDPKNPLTPEKVTLGMMLFHDPSLGTAGKGDTTEQWSCASCHHAAAGFKSGVIQGIGEGGSGFGNKGEARAKLAGYLEEHLDVQPVTSPAVLNGSFQNVVLWNGQLGNSTHHNTNANTDMAADRLDLPVVAANAKQLGGLETQVIVGGTVHRLPANRDQIVAKHPVYGQLFDAAFGPSDATPIEDVSHAIAAFERTILANKAPFQEWLRGDETAMTLQQLRGASVFFGKGQCAQCHQGPGLSSAVDAGEEDVFFAVGFGDMDMNPMVGVVPEKVRLGRGAVTGRATDNYKFKIPQLYNLADANVFGHGGTFQSLRAVVDYKNAAIAQSGVPIAQLDRRFRPLGLTDLDKQDLVAFLEQALYDPDLDRYVPSTLPTGACAVNADIQSRLDLGCEGPDLQKLARHVLQNP